MYNWEVAPLCEEQLLDVDLDDVLDDGTFRKCDVYKSGGGYDRFPNICFKRLGKRLSEQFVVQLRGCHLQCPYCYVTPNGVWGKYLYFSSYELVASFLESGCDIFHLMGGAPALRIENWSEIIDELPAGYVFHSDLLLTEKEYDDEVLKNISRKNCLYAVNIKGVSPNDYRLNTGKAPNFALLHSNMNKLVRNEVPFYITFTNPDMRYYDGYCGQLRAVFGDDILEDSFVIDLKEYAAIGAYEEKHCDE